MARYLTRQVLSPDVDLSSAEILEQIDYLAGLHGDHRTQGEVVASLDALAELMIGRQGRGDAELRERIRQVRESVASHAA